MQIEQIVALLVAERDRLTRAIEALSSPTKRRGRPPKSHVAAAADYDDPTMPDWVKPASVRQPTVTKRKSRTAAQLKAHSERMKAYWSARRNADAKPAAAVEPARKKRTFTAAQRKEQGERMKAYWVAKKKAAAKAQPKAAAKKKAAKAS